MHLVIYVFVIFEIISAFLTLLFESKWSKMFFLYHVIVAAMLLYGASAMELLSVAPQNHSCHIDSAEAQHQLLPSQGQVLKR